jgi:uncharacterized protein (UPF0303 family)
VTSADLAAARAICDFVVRIGAERGLALAVRVTRGDMTVAQLCMDGTQPDHEEWLRRKTNVVRRFGRSSLDIARLVAADPDATMDLLGLDWRDYALVGGAVPVMVEGLGMVGIVAVSGADQVQDHEIATLATGGG